MHLANIIKLRSNCMKRGVGALIVKDSRIVSTGNLLFIYNFY
jgi:deoxycytidylate deaminase